MSVNRWASFLLGSLMALRAVAQETPVPTTAVAILQQHCIECHGSDVQESGLRLDSRRALLHGGDFGPAVVLGHSTRSELLRRVTSSKRGAQMPPEGPRLSPDEIAALTLWIDSGAEWPADQPQAEFRDPRLDHWAWQPLRSPPVPEPVAHFKHLPGVEDDRSPVDRFIRRNLAAQGLTPSPVATRRTLIRRLCFDLCGLPPSPEEIAEFERDPEPRAYERLVDRLLASPQYGEKWARHWLDVVHYGDTHGYDKDKPRPHAWPYRDYVIRAFNTDKPYAQFVEEQIAGDVLFPETRDGYEALGFIAAGPWDLIGHEELSEDKTDGKIARHLDRDDMVANAIGTFNSVTIQCAQCHQHKFDPISQDDYYSLQAVFAAIDRGDRLYSPDTALREQHASLKWQVEALQRRAATLDEHIKAALGPRGEELVAEIAAGERSAREVQGGYHSAIETSPHHEKWVQLDFGKEVAVHAVELHPCYDDFNRMGAGFGFPPRYRVEASTKADFSSDVQTLANFIEADVAPPGLAPRVHQAEVTARYVRITATKLAPRSGDFIFALAEIRVKDAAGRNVALGAQVTALDSIEAPPRWTQPNIVNGRSPSIALERVAVLQAEQRQLLSEKVAPARVAERDQVRGDLATAEAAQRALSPLARVYAATTNKRDGKPRTIHVLTRGNVLTPAHEAQPGALAILAALPQRFELPPAHTEGDRRVALARWLSSPENPLTWRSIVNRVWQYHWGRGLVETSNDFGRMGSLPTDPELLDWLAVQFRDEGGSLKSLHRRLVNSATYRQQSAARPDAVAIDGGNQWLWRFSRRRLEAEAVRDSVLAVAGTLDLRQGGPGWQDFRVERPEHSPHYRYDLADPEDRSTWRRSVYRFVVRSQTHPFMTVLDCADPSMRVERRHQSLSALQALSLLNNGFILVQATHFAERVAREAGDEPQAQLRRAFALACGREPDADELAALLSVHQHYGLTNVCRALFNLNEFVFVD